MNSDERVAGEKWDRYIEALSGAEVDNALKRAEWQHHPRVSAHVNHLCGGSLDSWIIRHLPDGCRTVLSVGAGTASREITLLADGHFEQLVLVDVSSVGLAKCRDLARELGVEERVVLVEGGYSAALLASISERCNDQLDAVLFLSSLHHLDDVPRVLVDVRDRLSNIGVVVGNEYVGPNRFAFDSRVRALADASYRWFDPLLRGPWPSLPTPDPVDVARDDPSEAVDSASILEALRKTFPQHRIVTLGGALAYPVWFGLNHDALHDTEEGHRAVDELLRTDRRLTRSGMIPTYFCRFVGYKRQVSPTIDR